MAEGFPDGEQARGEEATMRLQRGDVARDGGTTGSVAARWMTTRSSTRGGGHGPQPPTRVLSLWAT
jgi:hypothetical protein